MTCLYVQFSGYNVGYFWKRVHHSICRTFSVNDISEKNRGIILMMTSSNGNIFRVTGPLCGEFTGPGEFPIKGQWRGALMVFFYLRLNKGLSKQPWDWWFETPSWSLWCSVCNKHIFQSNIKTLHPKKYAHSVRLLCLVTHCGLMTPYGDKDLSQHWLRWFGQLMPSAWYLNQCRLHTSEVSWHSPDSQRVSQILFCIMSFKIIILKSLPLLAGANKLTCLD